MRSPINHWLRKSFDSAVGLDDSDLALLSECMKAMETVAGHLDEGTGFFYVVHDTLRARIARAELDLDRRISEATDIVQRSSVSLQMPVIEDLPEALLEQAPATAPAPVEPVETAPEVESIPATSHAAPEPELAPPAEPEHELSAYAAPAEAAPAAMPPLVVPAPAAAAAAPADEPAADFDPEIASIFSEEAVELLDASQAALASWNDSPHDSSQAAALRRPLHTLKGGARMAGIAAMGELSHELESLITRIESGLASGDESARQLAQQALDELSKMRDQIAEGRPVARAPALIARIQAASGAGPRLAPVPEPAVSAEPAAPPPSESSVAPWTDIAVSTADRPGSADPAADAAEDAFAAVFDEPAAADEPTAARQAPAPPSEEAPIRFDLQPASDSTAELPPAAAEPQPQPDSTLIDPIELLLPSEPPLMEPSPEPVAELPEASTAGSTAAPFEPSLPAAAPAARTAMPSAPAAELPAPPAPVPPGREPVAGAASVEMARVSAELLDDLLNNAGEVSIARARLEQQLGSIEFNLGELSRTVTRLKEQLRKLEIETEAQILHRHEKDPTHRQDFDPLELDRYSAIQQFSRALAESASDVGSIQGLLENLIGEAQNLLQQQSRTVTELQNGLMRTRMVSVQRHVPRLARIVRQSAADTGKRAELIVDGASGELDRQVLERMLPPFEHMLRNAVVHGIEMPEVRRAAGKDETGHIRLSLRREGAEVIVEVSDDGAGMNLRAIRAKGLELGLIRPDQDLSDEDVMQLILEPGFSTASTLTEQAGRGVGMDVVAVEIKKLGGALHMESTPGQGSRFTIRLPFTLAISHALVVRTGDEYYALPLPTVEGVVRLPRAEVEAQLKSDNTSFTHGGQKYRLQPLALYVGMEAFTAAGAGRHYPGGAGTRRRAFDRAGGRRTGRQPRDRGQAGRPADLEHSWHLRRHHPWRRTHRRHTRYRRAGACRMARPRGADGGAGEDRSPHLRAGGRRLDYRAARHPAAARAQRHARHDRARRHGRRIAAGRTRTGYHPARHRDAAHGRLRSGGARAQRPAPA